VGGRTECDGALRSLENTLPSPCTEPFPIEGLSISGCEKYGVKAANEAENIHVASLSGQVANWGSAEEEKMERQHVLGCLRCAKIRRSPFFLLCLG
jgi:hypothetical protein